MIYSSTHNSRFLTSRSAQSKMSGQRMTETFQHEKHMTSSTETLDILIHNGSIIDGTGEPRWPGDVGIRNGRIVALGADLASRFNAQSTVDASGKIVAPGFIDTHGHDDLMFVERPDLAWKTSQGVTSVVVGNCGISAAPLPLPGQTAESLALLGDTPLFPSYQSYFEQVSQLSPMINVAALVGHANLRLSVMREPYAATPTPDEQSAMEAALAQALDDGAIGMSTGLAYAPGSVAGMEELLGLARVLAKHNAVHTSHIRNEGDDVEAAVEEVLDIGRQSGCRTVLSHHKCLMPHNWGRSLQTLRNIDDSRNAGLDVALDVYPYNASSTILIPERAEKIEDIKITWSTPHPEQAGRYLSDIARDWQCERTEAAQRLSPAGAIYFAMEEAEVQRILAHPCCMVGSDGLPNDANPHPRLWGSFTRVLGRYVRECQLLTLEAAIAKMTSLPAQVFGLPDRGRLAPGFHADVVVFDAGTVKDKATWEEPTLKSAGIEHVFINGVPAYPSAPEIRPGHILKPNRRQTHA